MKPVFLLISFLIGCMFMVSIREPHSSTTVSASGTETGTYSVMAGNSVTKSAFGKTKSGADVSLFTCKNAGGLEMKLMDYGATIVSLNVPDKNGKLANVVLTCKDIGGFEECTMYFNGSVGRFCNRIAQGKFSLEGQDYQLAVNNGPNHLHGGVKGFDKVMWSATPFEKSGAVGVEFKYLSKDGEEGYPGTLTTSVTYSLTDKNEFIVEFNATTDKTTHVNLTNHNYWNLAGTGTILRHELKLNSAKYLPVDGTGIPTGEMLSVLGSHFDFGKFTAMGKRFSAMGGSPLGYDHCYEVSGEPGKLRLAATVREPKSGRVMEIQTTEPGIQFYTGNFLDGTAASGGYGAYSAFCLETQHFPNAPNQPAFLSTVLKPGEKYYHKTVHTFSTE